MKKTDVSAFFPNDKLEELSKMHLLLDGKETEHYLLIRSIDAKSIQREKIKVQIKLRDQSALAESVDLEDTLALTDHNNKMSEINTDFAMLFVGGYSESFGDYNEETARKIVEQSKELASKIPAFAADEENRSAKK